MKDLILTAFIIFLGLTHPAYCASQLKGPYSGELVRVIDGDTIVAHIDIWLNQKLTIHIRLRGIDTPEIRGDCKHEKQLALKAKSHLTNLLQNAENLTLSDVSNDKFGGRVVAYVYANNINTSHAMIENNLATSYKGGHKHDWCESNLNATANHLQN